MSAGTKCWLCRVALWQSRPQSINQSGPLQPTISSSELLASVPTRACESFLGFRSSGAFSACSQRRVCVVPQTEMGTRAGLQQDCLDLQLTFPVARGSPPGPEWAG